MKVTVALNLDMFNSDIASIDDLVVDVALPMYLLGSSSPLLLEYAWR